MLKGRFSPSTPFRLFSSQFSTCSTSSSSSQSICRSTRRTSILSPHLLKTSSSSLFFISSHRSISSSLLSQSSCFSSSTSSSPVFDCWRPSCNDLRETSSFLNKEVMLCGWVQHLRVFQNYSIFIVLRDRSGTVQVTILAPSSSSTTREEEEVQKGKRKKELELFQLAQSLPLESVVSLRGIVRERPENQRNPNMTTGNIELHCLELNLLNEAMDQLPLRIPSSSSSSSSSSLNLASEEVRLRWRYLDLRRPQLQQNIQMRSQVTRVIRQVLWDFEFLEIETPTLFRPTPEGAREFLVPTQQPGKFYSLPQSPQQYKQLLMVAGFDRYFQLARCYRDEATRSDRQPEFTQVDLEMSFVKPNDVMMVIESILHAVWKSIKGHSIPLPLLRMPFQEAMTRFGVDKPDTRFGMEIRNIKDAISNEKEGGQEETSSSSFLLKVAEEWGKKGCVRGFNGGKLDLSRKELSELQDIAKKMIAVGGRNANKPTASSLFIVQVQEDSSWKSKGGGSGFFSSSEQQEVKSLFEDSERQEFKNQVPETISPGDLLIFVSGHQDKVSAILGRLRLHLATSKHKLLSSLSHQFNFLWVVDFPLFTPNEETGILESTHHPFTAPADPDLQKLFANPEDALGQHYDIVLNGIEIGGGSIRIHSSSLQQKVFSDILQLPSEKSDRFKHLVDALKMGAPPHGGIALGLDRICSILAGAESIRDVIAFPKTSSGSELLTNSPAALTDEELATYHLSLRGTGTGGTETGSNLA